MVPSRCAAADAGDASRKASPKQQVAQATARHLERVRRGGLGAWGNNFDCSGLTLWAYRQAGMHPRARRTAGAEPGTPSVSPAAWS